MAQQWYVNHDGAHSPPVTARQLVELARVGSVQPDQLVSLDQKRWFKARRVKGLVFQARTTTIFHAMETPIPVGEHEATAIMPQAEVRRPIFSTKEIGEEYDSIMKHRTTALPGYHVQQLIGQGSMGLVFQATQLKLQRDVAIKVVAVAHLQREVAQSRFQQESQIIAQFKHPHIVAAFDFGEHEHRFFLVMELIDGQGLDDWINQHGPMKEFEAWHMIHQAASGLAYAAQRGCIHRDVKPANILLVKADAGSSSELPMVKLTDFGLALMNDAKLPSERLTATGIVLGTPMYMAPEQFGKEDLDHRGDIYSLGATLAFALLAHSPFAGDSIWELMTNKTHDNRALLEKLQDRVSPESLRLIEAMLEPDRNKRIGSYEELLARIDQLPVMSRPASQPLLAIKPLSTTAQSKSWRTWWIAAPLGFCLLAGLLAFRFISGHATKVDPAQFQVSGYNEPLYDGVSLSNWKIVSGIWSATQDAESTRILSGQGTLGKPAILRRTLPPLKNYRISLGMDLREAEAVEVQFALAKNEETDPRRFAVRITREGATLGERYGSEGPWKALSSTVPLPTRADAGDINYWELRIDQLAGHWGAAFHGSTLKHGLRFRNDDVAEVRILVFGSTASFAELQIMELVEKKSD
jgi:eukaryotic-like serine/threonine-protein kinase